MSADAIECRVLIMGYRQGLYRAVRRAGMACAIWHDAPLQHPPRDATVHVAPFGRTRKESRAAAAALEAELGAFTHVIAGVERSVVAASHARRVLGARLSAHTTVMRGHDKLLMKEALRAAGVPVTDFMKGEPGNGGLAFDALGPRLVVKDRTESGGRGVQVVTRRQDAVALAMDGRLAERFVTGSEVSVEGFVRAGRVVFENVTRYVENGRVNLVPADLPADTLETLRAIHRQVVEALRLTWGITHCEFYLTDTGPVVGEIALRPPGGYIMQLIEQAYGFSAWDALVAIELGRAFPFPSQARAAAGVIILHPGAGTIASIEGLERVQRHPLTQRARLKAQAGDVVAARQGVGEDVGYVLLAGETTEAVRAALSELGGALRFDMR